MDIILHCISWFLVLLTQIHTFYFQALYVTMHSIRSKAQTNISLAGLLVIIHALLFQKFQQLKKYK